MCRYPICELAIADLDKHSVFCCCFCFLVSFRFCAALRLARPRWLHSTTRFKCVLVFNESFYTRTSILPFLFGARLLCTQNYLHAENACAQDCEWDAITMVFAWIRLTYSSSHTCEQNSNFSIQFSESVRIQKLRRIRQKHTHTHTRTAHKLGGSTK